MGNRGNARAEAGKRSSPPVEPATCRPLLATRSSAVPRTAITEASSTVDVRSFFHKSVLAYPEPMNPVIAIVLLAAPFAALAAAIAVMIVYLGKRTK